MTLVMGPLDADGVCSMGPCFAYGIDLVGIWVQIRGLYQGPIAQALDFYSYRKLGVVIA